MAARKKKAKSVYERTKVKDSAYERLKKPGARVTVKPIPRKKPKDRSRKGTTVAGRR